MKNARAQFQCVYAHKWFHLKIKEIVPMTTKKNCHRQKSTKWNPLNVRWIHKIDAEARTILLLLCDCVCVAQEATKQAKMTKDFDKKMANRTIIRLCRPLLLLTCSHKILLLSLTTINILHKHSTHFLLNVFKWSEFQLYGFDYLCVCARIRTHVCVCACECEDFGFAVICPCWMNISICRVSFEWLDIGQWWCCVYHVNGAIFHFSLPFSTQTVFFFSSHELRFYAHSSTKETPSRHFIINILSFLN